MKKLIGIALILIGGIAMAIDYADRPDFEEGQHYVWASGAVASNALAAINQSGWFPQAGYKNGVKVTDNATTSWAAEPKQRVDGKWVVPRIPETALDTYGVPEAQREAWWNGYNPDVETETNDWWPDEV